ncbi:ornithine decarboxylase-like [Aplysia californica]|uniref:Ornithine decarboxylase-like n=1 Tax=Aplysia californica TaxID=6500 RepID=A0ABM0JT61_APLCA|nr:ornithine decarboxylase-like [Aplysia californica]
MTQRTREIEQILSLDVHPSRVVYANPCKISSHIRYASHVGVDLMTFDGVHELVKIKKLFPNARLILRIHSGGDNTALHNFDKKFGCHPRAARGVLNRAKRMGLNVVGVR